MSRKAVCDGTMGPLTEELGVELRLRDCLPSRALDLLFPTIGGILGVVKGLKRVIAEALTQRRKARGDRSETQDQSEVRQL